MHRPDLGVLAGAPSAGPDFPVLGCAGVPQCRRYLLAFPLEAFGNHARHAVRQHAAASRFADGTDGLSLLVEDRSTHTTKPLLEQFVVQGVADIADLIQI